MNVDLTDADRLTRECAYVRDLIRAEFAAARADAARWQLVADAECATTPCELCGSPMDAWALRAGDDVCSECAR